LVWNFLLFNMLNMNITEIPGLIAVSLSIISFLIYWTIFSASRGRGILVIRARFAGFILMALLPVVILLVLTDLELGDIGLIPSSGSLVFIVISSLIFSTAGIFVTVFNPGAPKHFAKYPQIRDSKWTRSIFIWNLISWAVYLTGYEIMFRGIIIFTLLEPLGVWPAIAVSTALYSALHLQKGMFEALGALPLGILFSILTVLSGSIWIAAIVHVVMAVSNTLWSFKRHPEMEFVK
ncbi:MAG: CPBP family intramembrane metalloprotease, partial [Spirochaetales bacterium]|nr:CPBP family intramembrane metalloprotease [Spirochaetales bacterium]